VGISAMALYIPLNAQTAVDGRKSVLFTEGWRYVKDPSNKGIPAMLADNWENVQIPHSWNISDVMDDEPGYYRHIAWYRNTIKTEPDWKKKRVLLYFEGINQESEVYINGEKVGEHVGGYTAFSIDITQYLRFESKNLDEVYIKVNNRYNEDIPPLTADFTSFGGIYRKVYLLVLDPIHFDDRDYGGSGLFINTAIESPQNARIHIKGNVLHDVDTEEQIKIVAELFDKDGKKITDVSQNQKVIGRGNWVFEQRIAGIKKPQLWSPENPYLYKLLTSIYNAEGKLLDQLTNHIGFRWFSFDAKKGFYLNGHPLKLIGASRHQDFEDMGNAVPDSLQIKDLHLLKEMGGNFLRVAHYPQSPAVLKACDRLGILASVEIPVVNEITESDTFFENCLFMQREMIRQYYNHPSIIIWGYMNEVLLRPHFAEDKEKQESYFLAIKKLAQALEEVTRQEDTSRYTMIANHGNFNLYHRVGLTRIPMVVGWNLYPGWYGGKISDFGAQLDQIHDQLPDKPLLVTEYGADADYRLHADHPIRFDKSVEYAVLYHQGYLNDFYKRPFVAGAAAWNLSDFNSESREESMPHMNTKGLLSWDRRPKNTYYLYQAYLRKDPYVKIGTTYKNKWAGLASGDRSEAKQMVPVFTNADSVVLTVNGTRLGANIPVDKSISWELPLRNGKNHLLAEAYMNGKVAVVENDTLDFSLLPALFEKQPDWTELCVSVGDDRYYTDAEAKVWIPDQAYKSGSWGYIGGEKYRVKNTGRQNLGTDRNIRDTWEDPLYQTQQQGLSSYRLDVADGVYDLTLYFAELDAAVKKENLVYDLELQDREKEEEVTHRVFDIAINQKIRTTALNVLDEAGPFTALKKQYTVTVSGGAGLEISFLPRVGNAVLNGLKLKKIRVQ